VNSKRLISVAAIFAVAAIPALFPRAVAAKPDSAKPAITKMTFNLDGPDNMDLDAPHGQLVIDLTKKKDQLSYSSLSISPPKIDSFRPDELADFERALAAARAQILKSYQVGPSFGDVGDYDTFTIVSVVGATTFTFSGDYECPEFAPKKYDSVRKLLQVVKSIMTRFDPYMAQYGPAKPTPGAAGALDHP
jgi:hypothetical protein